MALIDSGYPLQCKDSSGGIKNIYLFSYKEYPRSYTRILENKLIQFPASVIYKFNTLKTASFNENMDVSSNGEFFDQSLTINFSKIGSTYNFEKIRKGYLRAIIQDNNGLYWFLGLRNGLEVTSYSKQTGASRQELNGYNITLTGKEPLEAVYMDVLTPFFSDTPDLFLSSSNILSSTSKKSSDKFI